MNHLRARWQAGHQESGSATLFLVISVVGLFALIGLVVDGGAKVRAVQRADNLAAEAGRAGGQAIDVPAAVIGNGPTLNVRAAAAAAQTYLKLHGVAGTVSITDGGRSLAVDLSLIHI